MNRHIIYFKQINSLVDFLNNIGKYKISIIDIISSLPVENQLLKTLNKVDNHRISISAYALFSGFSGMLLSFFMIYLIEGVDYKLNLGGKPFFTIITSIPIIFLISVLFSVIAVFITLLINIRNETSHYKNIQNDLKEDGSEYACIVDFSTIDNVNFQNDLVNSYQIKNIKEYTIE
jgi:ABC-type multidrug transport system fused ATPase/permease subunit